MLVDTSDIHAFGAALERHADDLASVAADLSAARVSADAFGSVGSRFLAALNDALIREADHAARVADRIAAAKSSAGAAATGYDESEEIARQRLSAIGT